MMKLKYLKLSYTRMMQFQFAEPNQPCLVIDQKHMNDHTRENKRNYKIIYAHITSKRIQYQVNSKVIYMFRLKKLSKKENKINKTML